jgi:hypothetical protein
MHDNEVSTWFWWCPYHCLTDPHSRSRCGQLYYMFQNHASVRNL